LGITPQKRAGELTALLQSYGYETACPHPLAPEKETIVRYMKGDKKSKAGKSVFVIPGESGARLESIVLDDPRLEAVLHNGVCFEQ
jgi:3-dehydroquinate synthetase